MPTIYKNGKNYGGGAIVDSVLSSTSTNPVQNKVVKQALEELILNFANYYNKTEVDNIVNTIKNSRFEAVATLPTTDIKTNVIYLVPKSPTQTNNIKDEYINLDGTSSGWEKIGDTEIDLSGYVTITALNTALSDYTTTTDLTTLLNNKVDKAQGKGLSTNDYTTTEKDKLSGIEAGAQVNTVTSVAGRTGAVTLTKSDVGLGNVDNTADANKSVNYATSSGKANKLLVTDPTVYPSLSFDAEGTTKLVDSNLYIPTCKAVMSYINSLMSRERRDITSDLSRLSIAVAEQNLEKYGYKIGDYFTGASGYTYILADYNTFKGTSTPYCITSNHLGIVVDTHQTSQWHSGDASSVGYNGSTLHTYLKGTVMDNIKADMIALFGGSTGLEHLLSHSKLLTTALANWGWQTDQYISALTCTQIDAGSQWTANGYQEGEASKSLELFRKYKWTEIFSSEYPWLRDLSNYGTGGSFACRADLYGSLYGDYSVTASYFVVGLINFH